MAQSLSTPYNDIGIYLPYHNCGHGNQWAHEEKLYADGFLLVEAVSRNEFVVQSLGNGKLYLNKLLQGGGKDFVGPRPPELKVSTSPAGAGVNFGVGYAGDPQNKPVPDRSREPGWWRAEDSDVTAETDATQSSREDEETEDGEGDDEDWMPEQHDVKMRGGGGDDDDGKEEKPWWHDIMAEGEDEEEEEATRDLEFLLAPDEPFFTKLMFWQKLRDAPDDVPVYSLYFEHSNGGTLADVRDAYRAARRRVPEHFIWHVAAQLCEALAHLYHYSDTDDNRVPDSDPDSEAEEEEEESGAGSEGERGEGERERPTVYHRNLFAANVAVHYRSPKGGPKPRGERTNAFPEIRLGGFGRAFIEGDPIQHVRPRAWDGDAEDAFPEEWEDVAALGTILRELATTHIIAPHPELSSGAVANHINRIRVGCANGVEYGRSSARYDPQSRPYTKDLIKVLHAFEWTGMTEHPDLRLCDARADGSFGYQDLPPMRWIAHKLGPMAQGIVAFQDRLMSHSSSSSAREDDPEAHSYRNLDVSWTKPSRLMPFVCSDHASALGAARLKRVQALLGPWEEVRGAAYEFVKVNFPSPKVSLVLSAKRKGAPEREKLPPQLEAALREPTAAAAAAISSSGSPDGDGDRSGGLKRARHH
ncbi:hypothetical protein PG993_015049 [Apiospora rasikravindrae]|uniref:Protein kinase domain-containing protein n=1 Tax=Apiospora rasikravindrae TaxID=990691 RepID=A0ABR1RPH4_9PEZI